VCAIEELLGRYSSGFGLENFEYGRTAILLYPRKLALTSPTSGRSLLRYSSLAYLGNIVCFIFVVGKFSANFRG
jgi:hypothetical protein